MAMKYHVDDQDPALSVRAIAIRDKHLLVQKGSVNSFANDPRTCYGFIGGHYEPGDTLVERLQMEFEEETNASVVSCTYAFVVENKRIYNGVLLQSVDHFFHVEIDRQDVSTKESHLTQHWLPIETLKQFDLRPKVVRDLIAEGKSYDTRHVVVPLEAV